MTTKEEKHDNEMDNHITKDNIRKFVLRERLSKKTMLQNLTLNQLSWLVEDIAVLMSNLDTMFNNSDILIHFPDEWKHENNTKIRNIVLNNLLNMKPTFNNDIDFKGKLIERWNKELEPQKKMLNNL